MRVVSSQTVCSSLTERERRFERAHLLPQRYSRMESCSSPIVARPRAVVLVRLECGGAESRTRVELPETEAGVFGRVTERSAQRCARETG